MSRPSNLGIWYNIIFSKKKKSKLENQDQIKMFEDTLEGYFTKKIEIEVKFYPDEWVNKWKNLLSKKNKWIL